MSTTASLGTPRLSLEAGTEGSVHLTLRNDSDVVEEYALRVVGPAESWAEILPDRVSLYPGQDTTAAITFHPPRSASVPAGDFIFGIQVLPTEHPEDAVLPEGVVEVLPFLETTGELMPLMSRGKRGARHHVALDNWGNVPVTVELAGSDPGDLLEFELQPPELTIEPGTVQFTAVRVRPAEKIWSGTPATLIFSVTATPEDGPPLRLDGSHVQDPALPWRTIKAVLFLLLLAAALTVAWHFSVESVRVSDPSKPGAPQGTALSVLPYGTQ
ncbi:COG1470 family protein [Arthrobacter globiformis]|uniref:Hydrolytic protein n=1 Tax=Arthrobacter globiformis TaxID=1665 RepID=A0A328HJ82_ARTGO|nr:hypothetical protein [Arthrobacter globiformis]RAM38657.1 hypothetical protein DBZ45_03470 [Arthrobacter globiformis]